MNDMENKTSTEEFILRNQRVFSVTKHFSNSLSDLAHTILDELRVSYTGSQLDIEDTAKTVQRLYPNLRFSNVFAERGIIKFKVIPEPRQDDYLI